MTIQDFPRGWDEARVRSLIAFYDSMSDEELAAYDDACARASADVSLPKKRRPKTDSKQVSLEWDQCSTPPEYEYELKLNDQVLLVHIVIEGMLRPSA